MAKSRQWTRYQPPDRRRTESGRPEDDVPAPSRRVVPDRSARAEHRPTARGSSSAKGSSTTKKPRKPLSANDRVRAIKTGVGVVSVVVLTVLIAVGFANGDDEPEPTYSADTLDEAFVAQGVELARAEAGEKPFRVTLNEYEFRAEYLDPNRNQIRTFTFSTYDRDDGSYEIRVDENYYDDFGPRPFDLAEVEPAQLVGAAKDAIEQAEGVFRWSVEVSTDYVSKRLALVATAGGEEDAEVTIDLS